MTFQLHSQSTLETTVNAYTNEKGDTMLVMTIQDAKVLLTGVLGANVADTLLMKYKDKDSINIAMIDKLQGIVKLLKEQNTNQIKISSGKDTIIINKDTEIAEKDKIIKNQKKEIRKQKILKKLSMIGCIVLPILVLIL